MASVESSAVKPPGLATVSQVPQLSTGDHLTRAEFERRYSAMPNVKKAELIDVSIRPSTGSYSAKAVSSGCP